jgi:hypothetical protein
VALALLAYPALPSLGEKIGVAPVSAGVSVAACLDCVEEGSGGVMDGLVCKAKRKGGVL